MRNSFWFVVLFSVILSFSHSYSQGIFLEKGEFGVFVDGGYSKFENGNGTSFGAGFSAGGYFEFEISRSTSEIEMSNYYYSDKKDFSSTSVLFGAVLIKKKAQLELNFGFTSPDLGSDALLAGFNVGSEIKLHEKLSFYPMFSFAVGIPIEENSGNPVTALGVAAQFLIGDHVYVGPSFALSEGNFSWGVSAGMIISFNVEND